MRLYEMIDLSDGIAATEYEHRNAMFPFYLLRSIINELTPGFFIW